MIKLSSSSDKGGDSPGPSSKLSEMPPISRSQSLSSLCSNNSDSDIEMSVDHNVVNLARKSYQFPE